jgi:uridine kinase
MSRESVLSTVARYLSDREVGHPLRVGIDGVCGSGKSTFSRALAEKLGAYGRPVIRLDSDGFHHVREIRYQQGKDSARGYYEDAYDFAALRESVLLPLGPDGSGRYAVRIHDLASDHLVREFGDAPSNAIVLFDATFIQRDGLRVEWDEVIFLDASLPRAQERGVARDTGAFGGVDNAVSAYESRYMAACRIYLAEQHPRERSSIVIDNDDPADPSIARIGHGPQR